MNSITIKNKIPAIFTFILCFAFFSCSKDNNSDDSGGGSEDPMETVITVTTSKFHRGC